MEQYVAEGSKPVDRCKADVRAADAYVIIVAWRFGYVPGRNASPPDGRSITEIELDEAQASGKPVLAFLLDPEAPWPPNRVDAMGGAPGAGEDVSRLRALLGTNYLAGIFRTPDDLAQVAAAGLPRADPHMFDPRCWRDPVASRTWTLAKVISSDSTWEASADDHLAGAARALVLPIDHGHRWWSTRWSSSSCCVRDLIAAVVSATWLTFRGMPSRGHRRRARQRLPGAREFARRLRQRAFVRHRRDINRQSRVEIVSPSAGLPSKTAAETASVQ